MVEAVYDQSLILIINSTKENSGLTEANPRVITLSLDAFTKVEYCKEDTLRIKFL